VSSVSSDQPSDQQEPADDRPDDAPFAGNLNDSADDERQDVSAGQDITDDTDKPAGSSSATREAELMARKRDRSPPAVRDGIEEGAVLDPDAARDAELDAREAICDQCGSTPALRFGRPYWVVRCRAHNPRTWKP
jgi:hypothetical protein